jgi:nucleoid-associated protein YgaU
MWAKFRWHETAGGQRFMAQNTARLIGGAGAAVVLALVVIALFPRVMPKADDDASVTASQAPAVPLSVVKTAPEPAPAGPTVDTFLLGLDGVAVIAGHGTPGATITLLLDGAAITQTTADASGSFAVTAEVIAADTPRSLTFSEDGAPPSGEAVLVRAGAGAPTEPVVVADAAPDVAPDAAVVDEAVAETAPVVVADAEDTDEAADASADAASMAEASDVATVAVSGPAIIVDAQGARVLGPGLRVMDRVALDAITYDTAGGVQLAGRAPGDGTLQVYVDNLPVVAGTVGPQGDWRVTLPQINAGTYTLRIDEVAADGTVASRVETQFRREAPENIAALRTGTGGMTVATQTVQPGNTLWAIARDNLGEGIMYVDLFEANADQIRDPDLIYPGQVFVIPDR